MCADRRRVPRAGSDLAREPALREALEVLSGLASPGGIVRALVSRVKPPVSSDEDRMAWSAEMRFRALVEQIPAVTFTAMLDGGLRDVYVSPQIEDLLGFNQEEWVRDPVLWWRQLHPDDRAMWNEEFTRGIRTGGPFRAECRFFAKDGRVVWVHGEARLLADETGRLAFLQGVAFDITATKEAQRAVERSLHEKELLLKEIHHRVKNNLQLTSSLLNLQARQVGDPNLAELFQESQHRIRAMALVHERLYRSADLATVDFSAYVADLARMLSRSYRSGARITTTVAEIEGRIELAVPLGLILNELVSNALKHAFPGDRSGEVRVALEREGESMVLRVEDDGVGLPGEPETLGRGSLGLQMVRTLARQLGGRVEMSSDEGTRVTVTVPART